MDSATDDQLENTPLPMEDPVVQKNLEQDIAVPQNTLKKQDNFWLEPENQANVNEMWNKVKSRAAAEQNINFSDMEGNIYREPGSQSVQQLHDKIDQFGLDFSQKMVVALRGKRYTIVDGMHRFRVFTSPKFQAEHPEVKSWPCLVIKLEDLSNMDRDILSAMFNRKNLTYVEESEANHFLLLFRKIRHGRNKYTEMKNGKATINFSVLLRELNLVFSIKEEKLKKWIGVVNRFTPDIKGSLKNAPGPSEADEIEEANTLRAFDWWTVWEKLYAYEYLWMDNSEKGANSHFRAAFFFSGAIHKMSAEDVRLYLRMVCEGCFESIVAAEALIDSEEYWKNWRHNYNMLHAVVQKLQPWFEFGREKRSVNELKRKFIVYIYGLVRDPQNYQNKFSPAVAEAFKLWVLHDKTSAFTPLGTSINSNAKTVPDRSKNRKRQAKVVQALDKSPSTERWIPKFLKCCISTSLTMPQRSYSIIHMLDTQLPFIEALMLRKVIDRKSVIAVTATNTDVVVVADELKQAEQCQFFVIETYTVGGEFCQKNSAETLFGAKRTCFSIHVMVHRSRMGWKLPTIRGRAIDKNPWRSTFLTVPSIPLFVQPVDPNNPSDDIARLDSLLHQFSIPQELWSNFLEIFNTSTSADALVPVLDLNPMYGGLACACIDGGYPVHVVFADEEPEFVVAWKKYLPNLLSACVEHGLLKEYKEVLNRWLAAGSNEQANNLPARDRDSSDGEQGLEEDNDELEDEREDENEPEDENTEGNEQEDTEEQEPRFHKEVPPVTPVAKRYGEETENNMAKKLKTMSVQVQPKAARKDPHDRAIPPAKVSKVVRQVKRNDSSKNGLGPTTSRTYQQSLTQMPCAN